MIVSLIAAAAYNNTIGSGNEIPWHLPDDLRFFKKTTGGHPIIMGRKTWESIGRPLPGRVNIVVTRSKNYLAEGARICHNLQDAFEFARQSGTEEVFVIGGGQIYRHAMKYASRIYLTKVFAEIPGDVTFPEIDSDWMLTSTEKHSADEKHKYDFEFRLYEKIPDELIEF